jgi:hypothetical protein
MLNNQPSRHIEFSRHKNLMRNAARKRNPATLLSGHTISSLPPPFCSWPDRGQPTEDRTSWKKMVLRIPEFRKAVDDLLRTRWHRRQAVGSTLSHWRMTGDATDAKERKALGLYARPRALVYLLAGWGPRGRRVSGGSSRRDARSRETDVVVKHSADSGYVGHPVAKCREAPLLFSAVNLRLQDRRARRCRRGACRGS